MPTDAQLLSRFETLALAAGHVVMEAYTHGCEIGEKADTSPVTAADREAERVILSGLREFCPAIPVIAEEAVAAGDYPANPGEEFLLVDPLDGTREFVARRAEFTINIALVRKGEPVLGVVYAPASRLLYSGMPGLAERAETTDGHEIASRRPVSVRRCGPVPAVVASRSHRSEETDRYIASLPQAEIVSIGSSLKFCMLAEGEADLYPRFGRTMQWDTAAGDAVLRAAGGLTCTLDGEALAYGPHERQGIDRFANPWFVAKGVDGPPIPVSIRA
jgi:3'(2'), 5'-bisphosphate nucleotidase